MTGRLQGLRRAVCWQRSLRAGSVARRWAGGVRALHLSCLGRGLAAAGLALDAWRRAFLPRRDAQPLHPPRVGIEHFDLEIARTRNDLAAHRQAADVAHEVAAQRLDFLTGFAGDEILADHGADVVEA